MEYPCFIRTSQLKLSDRVFLPNLNDSTKEFRMIGKTVFLLDLPSLFRYGYLIKTVSVTSILGPMACSYSEIMKTDLVF